MQGQSPARHGGEEDDGEGKEDRRHSKAESRAYLVTDPGGGGGLTPFEPSVFSSIVSVAV